MSRYIAILLLLAGCSAPSSWCYDSISNGESAFESSRLLYNNPGSNLKLELLRLGNEIHASIFLTLHRFTASLDHSVAIILSIDGQEFSEQIVYYEGRMRLSLPQKLTEKLIFALQEGKPVDILVDGFRETISPESFDTYYNKLLKGDIDLLKYIKGSLQ